MPLNPTCATVQVTPTVQAAAYAAGNVIGGLLTLTGAARAGAGSGLIQSVAASFKSGVAPTSLDVVFFSANPSGSTLTDKTAIAVVAADIAKVIGVAHLTDTTLLGASAPSLLQAQLQTMPFFIAGTALFAAVVTRSAITLTSTTDMTLSVRTLPD